MKIKQNLNKRPTTRLLCKRSASFTGCMATKHGVVAYGETSDGITFYADPIDIEKGFRFFTTYKIRIFADGKDVPERGFHQRAQIIRPTFLGQVANCTRLSLLKDMVSSLLERDAKREVEVVSKVEGIVPDRLLSTSPVGSMPTPYSL